jgi:hypothetical protein
VLSLAILEMSLSSQIAEINIWYFFHDATQSKLLTAVKYTKKQLIAVKVGLTVVFRVRYVLELMLKSSWTPEQELHISCNWKPIERIPIDVISFVTKVQHFFFRFSSSFYVTIFVSFPYFIMSSSLSLMISSSSHFILR